MVKRSVKQNQIQSKRVVIVITEPRSIKDTLNRTLKVLQIVVGTEGGDLRSLWDGRCSTYENRGRGFKHIICH